MDTMTYLTSRRSLGSRPGLARIERLCELLGNPQDQIELIHVAGTNGKGSTCAFMESMLHHAGYRVGRFSSPYVLDYREQISLNSQWITAKSLDEIIREIKPFCDEMDAMGEMPTEFEILTAAALLFFYRRGCQYGILEAGMGGLGDSTNVAKHTKVCVFTHFAMDHMQFLGDTLTEIAHQKCGILKANAKAVSYPFQQAEAMDVIRRACEAKGVPLTVADAKRVSVQARHANGTDCVLDGTPVHLSMAGDHMVYNALTAVTAVKALLPDFPEDAIQKGLADVTLPGRIQVLSQGPLIIGDGGHNPDCAAALVDYLNKQFSKKQITAVMGMLGDKDYESYLSKVAPLCKRIYTLRPDSPRGLSAEALAQSAAKFCPNVQATDSMAQALALAKAQRGDLILICGSFCLFHEI